MSAKKSVSRRDFLRRSASLAAAAVGVPYIVDSKVFGKGGNVAPSDKIVMGAIGLGWQGSGNLHDFLVEDDAKMVAVCDIDKNHLENAKNRVDEKYGNKDCVTYHNFEEIIARDDIDALSIALPDHWHSVPAIMAAKAGKDIYGEKPLSHSLVEGRAMCDAVKKYDRVWQTGSWQRSQSHFRFACELVLNGCIGKIHTVEVGLPSGMGDFGEGNMGKEGIEAPPATLDFERWLGPSPSAPYRPAMLPKTWRWIMDYGGGQLMDWVGHHVDIAHWGMGMQYDGPTEIEGYGEWPKDGLWDAAIKYYITAKYPNDITMIMAGGHGLTGGTKWIGENGWVWVDRSGIDASDKSLLRKKFSPNEINLFRSPGHWREFLDCVKSRKATLAPCEVAHRSASPGHLGIIAMKTGRKIKWDAANEKIIGDPQATRMLLTPMRSPWHI